MVNVLAGSSPTADNSCRRSLSLVTPMSMRSLSHMNPAPYRTQSETFASTGTNSATVIDRNTCIWMTSHTHTHPFNGPLSRTTQVSQYQKGKTNLDFTEARDGEWQRHQLGHMQVCTSLLTDNHDSTPPLSFLQAGYPSCDPTNSVKALKAQALKALKRMTSVIDNSIAN